MSTTHVSRTRLLIALSNGESLSFSKHEHKHIPLTRGSCVRMYVLHQCLSPRHGCRRHRQTGSGRRGKRKIAPAAGRERVLLRGGGCRPTRRRHVASTTTRIRQMSATCMNACDGGTPCRSRIGGAVSTTMSESTHTSADLIAIDEISGSARRREQAMRKGRRRRYQTPPRHPY